MKIQCRRIRFPVTRILSAIFYHHGVTENTLTLRQNLDKVMKKKVREREREREREKVSKREERKMQTLKPSKVIRASSRRDAPPSLDEDVLTLMILFPAKHPEY